MRFLSAGALWWMLLGVIIILFYLLKLRRTRRVVPSVLLWQRAMEELEANAPLKRLRRSLLLLLQLFILTALVLALARPLVATRALAEGSTVIVIDATASMNARDENGRTRLERAREVAHDIVAGLGAGDRAAVLEAAARVTVRSALTGDRAALRRAIDEVEPSDAAGTLGDALLLAEQMAKAERDAGIVVISDGGSAGGSTLTPAPASLPAHSGAAVRFVRVGRRAMNVGIVAFNARAETGDRRALFASVANFGDGDREIGAELRMEGQLIDARTITVASGQRAALVFDALPRAGGVAELRLNVEDDLAADNVAYAFVADARRPRVGVAAENLFLLQALAVNPDIEAHRLGDADPATFDCLIVEGAAPQAVLDSKRPLLAVHPAEAPGLWRVSGERQQPEITAVERAHPVNSFLSYADLHIESAPHYETAAWLRPVASAAGEGLIWAGEADRRRVVLIGFDLAKSDLPLKVEFPLLLANSIAWLAGRDAGESERVARAGEAITLRLPAAATVTTPDGQSLPVTPQDGAAVFAETRRVGLYQVEGGAGFAVSLLSERESDTTPREAIQTRAGEVTRVNETVPAEREAWRWLALLALAVLTVEWWVYHRRAGV